MEIRRIHEILRAHRKGDALNVPISSFGHEQLTTFAGQYLPGGSIQMTLSGEPILLEEQGEILVLGVGRQRPFEGQNVMLRLYTQGKDLHLDATAAMNTKRSLDSSLPALADSWLGAMVTTNSTSTSLTLQSEGEIAGLYLKPTLDLAASTGGLSSLLGVSELSLSGKLECSDEGRTLNDIYLQCGLTTNLDLGLFKLEEVRLVIDRAFSGLLKNDVMVHVPSLCVEAKIAVPVLGELRRLSLGTQTNSLETVHFSVDVPNDLALGLGDLVSLGANVDLPALLPPGLDVPGLLTLRRFGVEVALGETRAISYVDLTIGLVKRWSFFNLTPERSLALEDVEVQLAIAEPMSTTPNVSFMLCGFITLGAGVRLQVGIGANPWQIFACLPDDSTLSLGELLRDLLADVPLNLPEAVISTAIDELVVMGDLSAGAMEVKAGFTSVLSANLWGAPCELEMVLHANLARTTTPHVHGKVAAELSLAGATFAGSIDLGAEGVLSLSGKDLSLQTLLRDVLGASLPEGMPDLRSELLSLTLSTDGSFSIKGGFAVTEQRLGLGNTALPLLKVNLEAHRKGKHLDVALDLSGQPNVELLPGARCEAFALKFIYKSENEIWSVAGSLTTCFFDDRRLVLRADYAQHAGDTEIAMKLATSGTHEPLIAIAAGDQPLLHLSPRALSLVAKRSNGQWAHFAFDALGDLELFAAGREPIFSLREGKLALVFSEGHTSLGFTPGQAILRFVDVAYPALVAIDPTPRTEMRQLRGSLEFGAFTLRRGDTWKVDAQATISLSGLPRPLDTLLAPSMTVTAQLNENGLTFRTEGGLAPLVLPNPFADIKGLSLPDIGSSAIQLQGVCLELTRNPAVTATLGFALPSRLNQALGLGKMNLFRTWNAEASSGWVRLDVRLDADGISGKLLDSPFGEIHGISTAGENIEVDLDRVFGEKNLGRITLTKPTLQLDTKSGAFVASGGYAIDAERGLALPLGPLHALLDLLQLQKISQSLPRTLPIRSMDLDPAGLGVWLKEILPDLPPPFLDLLHALGSVKEQLPSRLQGYLSIKIPTSVHFKLQVTADGGVSGIVETTGDPLQILVPSPTQLTGIRLRKLDFGTAFGGSLLRLGLDATFDTFDYASLILSFALAGIEGTRDQVPAPKDLCKHLEIRDLLMLVIYQAGVPIPIPVFYEALDINWVGAEGFEIRSHIACPRPKVDVLGVVGLLKEIVTSVAKNQDLDTAYGIRLFEESAAERRDLDLQFSAGPIYVRLPKWLTEAGKEPPVLGLQKRLSMPSAQTLFRLLFNSARHLFAEQSIGYAVGALHLDHRMGDVDFSLLGALRFQASWVLATPEEFVTQGRVRGLDAEDARSVVALLPARDEGEGVVSFMRGALSTPQGSSSIGAFHVALVSGVAVTGAGARFGARILGKLGDKFCLDLGGSAQLSKDRGSVIEGHGALTVLGQAVAQGAFCWTPTSLSLESTLNAGPIFAHGSLNGHFRQDHLELKGAVSLGFWALQVQGSAHLLVTPETQSFELEARTRLGNLSQTDLVKRVAQREEQVAAMLFVSVVVGDLADFRLSGNLAIDNAARLQCHGQGHLILLGNRAEGSFEATSEHLRLNAKVQLFPGLTNIAMEATLHGQLTATNLLLEGTSTLTLWDLQIPATARLYAGGGQETLTVEVDRLFGARTTLTLQKAGQNLAIAARANAPLSFLPGILELHGEHGGGPSGSLSIDGSRVTGLMMQARAKLLHLEGTVNADLGEGRAKFRLTQSTNSLPGLTGDFGLDVNYQAEPLLLTATSHLRLSLDIGKAVEGLLRNRFGLNVTIPPVKIEIELDNFELRVEHAAPRNQVDPQMLARIAKRLAEAEKEIAELAIQTKDWQRGLIDREEVLRTHIADLRRERDEATSDERKAWLGRLLERLERHQAEFAAFAERSRTTQVEKDMKMKFVNVKKKSCADAYGELPALHDYINWFEKNRRGGKYSTEEKRWFAMWDAFKQHMISRSRLGFTRENAEVYAEKIQGYSHWVFAAGKEEHRNDLVEWRGKVLAHAYERIARENAELERAQRLEQVVLDEIKTLANEVQKGLDESASLLMYVDMERKLATESEREGVLRGVDLNMEGAMESAADVMAFMAEGPRIFMRGDIRFKSDLLGLTNEVCLKGIGWSSSDPNANPLAQLGTLLLGYLEKHLLEILWQGGKSFLAIIQTLLQLARTPSPASFSVDTASSDDDLAKIFAGYGELTPEEGHRVLGAVQHLNA